MRTRVYSKIRIDRTIGKKSMTGIDFFGNDATSSELFINIFIKLYYFYFSQKVMMIFSIILKINICMDRET